MNTNYGCQVALTKTDGTALVFRNVTEIHYNFGQSPQVLRFIAFELDIHGGGCNILISDIKEFETTLETEKQERFN